MASFCNGRRETQYGTGTKRRNNEKTYSVVKLTDPLRSRSAKVARDNSTNPNFLCSPKDLPLVRDGKYDDDADEGIYAFEYLLKALEVVLDVPWTDLNALRTKLGDGGLLEGRGAYEGRHTLDVIGIRLVFGQNSIDRKHTNSPDAMRAWMILLPVVPVEPMTSTSGFGLAIEGVGVVDE